MSVFCKIGKRNKRQKQKQKRSLTLLHFQNTSCFLVLGKRNKKQKQERRRLTTLLHFQNTSPLAGPGVASFSFHFVPAVFSCSNTRPRSYTTFSPHYILPRLFAYIIDKCFCQGVSSEAPTMSRGSSQVLFHHLPSTLIPHRRCIASHEALAVKNPHTLLHPKHQHHHPPPLPRSYSSPHHRTAKARFFVCFLLHAIAPRLDHSCAFCFVVRLLATCFILWSEL